MLLALIAVLCLLMATPFGNHLIHAMSVLVLYLAPMIVFLFVMIVRLICKVKGFHICKRCKKEEIRSNCSTEVAQEAQCLLPPPLITATKLSSYSGI